MYIYLLILLVLIIFILCINKKVEKFEDLYFGILPKDNHPNRFKNLLYYNDPIFLEYGKKYISLKGEKNIGELNDIIKDTIYISPKKKRNGLSPIEYNEIIYINSDNNKKHILHKEELKIVPHVRPINNQQPYLEIGDYVTIKKGNDYLVINPMTNVLEIINTKDVPNNGIFKILNSPQCSKNYKLYGLDNRKSIVTNLKLVRRQIRENLEKEKEKIGESKNNINNLKKQILKLKENIANLENNVGLNDSKQSNSRMNYESELSKLKDNLEKRRFELKRTIENRKELAENVIDEMYVKELKKISKEKC